MKVLLRQWQVVLTADRRDWVFTPAVCDEPAACGVASAVFGVEKVIRVVDEGTFEQSYGAQSRVREVL
jgi:hypothetical protein